MRHPFQRRGNPRNTVTTPFQKELVGHLQALGGGDAALSGRQFSMLLGRSANHVSQMLNDGFVPSGPSIIEMAEALHLDAEQTERLVRSAMETKAGQRSRDNFWIQQSLRMLDRADRERATFQEFLAQEGLLEKYGAFLSARAPRRKRVRE